jgi:hypothetical protein
MKYKKLAEKISNISKIEISEPIEEETEEEPVDYTPPATETMAKILCSARAIRKKPIRISYSSGKSLRNHD